MDKSMKRVLEVTQGVLEESELVAARVEQGPLEGISLFVGLVPEGRYSGFVVAIRVLDGSRHRRKGGYGFPVEVHRECWTRSMIPVIGIIFDPASKRCYWENLTRRLREDEENASEILVSRENVISESNLDGVLESAADMLGIVPDIPGVYPGMKRFEGAVLTGSPLFYVADNNPLVNLYRLNQSKFDWVAIWLWPIPVLAVMAFELPAQLAFAGHYTPSDPHVWIGSTYGTIATLVIGMYIPSIRSRFPRPSLALFGTVTFILLWTPVMMSEGGVPWLGELWAFISYFVCNFVMIHFIVFAFVPDRWIDRVASRVPKLIRSGRRLNRPGDS